MDEEWKWKEEEEENEQSQFVVPGPKRPIENLTEINTPIYTLFYPLRCPTTDPGIIITNIMAARTILKCSYGKSKLSSTKYVLTSSILYVVLQIEREKLLTANSVKLLF